MNDANGLWHEGWYQFARKLPSPNFGPRPPQTAIDLVVLHAISLPPGVYGTANVQALFTNQLDCEADPYFKSIEGLQVSAHFLIERQGQLWQFVSCSDRAWHAGVSSHRGRTNCNDYSIGIELEGLEGDRFEPDQYETLLTLLASLAVQYPISAVTGHEHIAPGRKADPGPGLDWHFLQRASGLAPQYFPDTVVQKKI